MKRLFIISILIGILFNSCKEWVNFNKVPYLEFVSLTKIDDGTSIDKKAILILYFTDGDGDIGSDETFDSGSPNQNDFFITYYAKRNGEFVTFPELEMMYNARLPRFLSSDNPEPLEGEIERILDIYNMNPVSPDVDTIRFECWIVDRKLNESNHVFTDEILVRNR